MNSSFSLSSHTFTSSQLQYVYTFPRSIISEFCNHRKDHEILFCYFFLFKISKKFEMRSENSSNTFFSRVWGFFLGQNFIYFEMAFNQCLGAVNELNLEWDLNFHPSWHFEGCKESTDNETFSHQKFRSFHQFPLTNCFRQHVDIISDLTTVVVHLKDKGWKCLRIIGAAVKEAARVLHQRIVIQQY